MKLVTDKGLIVCNHVTGIVVQIPLSQDFVRIDGGLVLAEPNPGSWEIIGCSNLNPPAGIKPCTRTVTVEVGYSDFIRINHNRVCLDTITGLTDGTPPGAVNYKVEHAGQSFVSQEGN